MLPVSLEKINFIISMAREYREGAPAMINEQLDKTHNSDGYTEHNLATIVNDYKAEEHAKDGPYNELKSAIDSLNEEEKLGLVALMWIGRGTYSVDEFDNAIKDARTGNNLHTAEYLIDSPLLPDYLEEAIIQLEDN